MCEMHINTEFTLSGTRCRLKYEELYRVRVMVICTKPKAACYITIYSVYYNASYFTLPSAIIPLLYR